jgi:macrodomain Ter protein organizer (MatP/YcbG family)
MNSHHIARVLRHLERHPHQVATWVDRHIAVILIALVVALIIAAANSSRRGS